MDYIISRLSLSLIVIIIVISVNFSLAINEEDQRPLLHDLLEKALIGDSTNLFELQKVYFNPAGNSPGIISLSARVTVGNISNTTYIGDCPAFDCNDESSQCHSDSFNFTLSPYSELNEDDSTLQIPNLVGAEGYDVLQNLDPFFGYLTGMLAIPQWLENVFKFSEESDSEGHVSEVELEFYISELESMPEHGELCDALSVLLVWAKAYARSSESEKQNNDRSIISVNDTAAAFDQWYCADQCELTKFNGYYSKSETLSAAVALNLILGIVLLTNILLFILILGYFHGTFNWLFKKEWVKKSFYPSSAIVLSLINGFIIIYDLLFLSVNYRFSSTKLRAGLVFNLLATVLMPTLEFLWVTFKICRCYSPQLGKCKIFLHSFGFCQIIWFVHRLLIDIIISVITFVIAPAQTIGIITLILFTILSVIIFIAQLFNIKCHCNWNTLSSLICILVIGSISVVLVAMITLLFITLVDNGLQSAGMGGFILSIIPPLIALIIGVYINRQTLDGFCK